MLYDSHTHTVHSDGRSTVSELCYAAWEKGLDGVTVSDHANMNYYRDRDTYRCMQEALEAVAAAKEAFDPLGLKVLRGIELGEYTYAPEKAREVLSLGGFDAILCAVHLVPAAGWSCAYNRIDFSDPRITDEEIDSYFHHYWQLLSQTVDAFDFDIETGSLSNRRTVFELPEGIGNPDGACIDSEGMMWIALWDGHKAIRVNPMEGKIVDEIEIPAVKAACCSFAGDDMKELIIASCFAFKPEEAAEYPFAGSLFRITVDVPGVAPYLFG